MGEVTKTHEAIQYVDKNPEENYVAIRPFALSIETNCDIVLCLEIWISQLPRYRWSWQLGAARMSCLGVQMA